MYWKFWKMPFSHICGLYYKHVAIVNDDSSIISKWSFKLRDDPRVIIYDHHRFIIQATGNIHYFTLHLLLVSSSLSLLFILSFCFLLLSFFYLFTPFFLFTISFFCLSPLFLLSFIFICVSLFFLFALFLFTLLSFSSHSLFCFSPLFLFTLSFYVFLLSLYYIIPVFFFSFFSLSLFSLISFFFPLSPLFPPLFLPFVSTLCLPYLSSSSIFLAPRMTESDLPLIHSVAHLQINRLS